MARQVLITGGTSGIGAGIAAAFAALGDQVTVTGATAAEVDAATGRAGTTAQVLDVRDGAAVQALVADLVATLGPLDVLVNCAGVIRRGAEHDPLAFADTVDINLNGTMRVCAAARPALAARRGCIINTASMLSFFGGGLVPGYSASKGGVAQLTKSLAIPESVQIATQSLFRQPANQLCDCAGQRSQTVVDHHRIRRPGAV